MRVGERLRAGQLAPPLAQSMEMSLNQLSTALGGCERLAGTPIPFTYSVIIHRCIYLYCMLLPFGLLDSIGLMTPVIVCFIAYTSSRWRPSVPRSRNRSARSPMIWR